MKHVAGGIRLAVALLAISAARCLKGGESAASPLVAETIPWEKRGNGRTAMARGSELDYTPEGRNRLWWLARVRHRDT